MILSLFFAKCSNIAPKFGGARLAKKRPPVKLSYGTVSFLVDEYTRVYSFTKIISLC